MYLLARSDNCMVKTDRDCTKRIAEKKNAIVIFLFWLSPLFSISDAKNKTPRKSEIRVMVISDNLKYSFILISDEIVTSNVSIFRVAIGTNNPVMVNRKTKLPYSDGE